MKTFKILVVDDEPRMGLVVQRALKKFTMIFPDTDEEINFDVQHVICGEDALPILDENPPDILLLDYKMPGLTGLDVLKHIDEHEHDMAAILITAYASLETAISATNQGANQILVKPFSNEDLQKAIQKAVRRLVFMRQERYASSNKQKGDFSLISIAAHELKSPLNRIEEFLYMLRDRYAGESLDSYNYFVERHLNMIRSSREMISHLLDLSKIENNDKSRELTEFDVVEVAKKVVENTSMEAAKRGIAVNFHSKNSIRILSNVNEIEIILSNLISNAIKYNKEGGQVDINVEIEDNKLIIIVADNGIGISKDEAAKLFTEFARIKNEKTRFITGSGLGLYLVRKIANLYGGEVFVTSEPDVGSVFTAILNIIPAETVNNRGLFKIIG